MLESVDSLKTQRPDTEISLVWIPGHIDITGNEMADEMEDEMADEVAKETAKSRGTHRNPIQHKPLNSLRNNTIKQASKNE